VIFSPLRKQVDAFGKAIEPHATTAASDGVSAESSGETRATQLASLWTLAASSTYVSSEAA
jgi:hypothetical protein